jgi:hypothetical protein
MAEAVGRRQEGVAEQEEPAEPVREHAVKMQFEQGQGSGRRFETRRPAIQTRSRYLNERAPNPYAVYSVNSEATRMPGRGVSGESTN